ncbi:TetR/AcrR family transcriptional regulator C-terminal domain-containing protein [Streptomyces sp. NRRL F-5727]|uniref:TetR/AcrR family transcriptional regulator C-terminal domain-containing protein n=1 Tax=Streptomyces sp. NRRL F-5727 TaxID=1463871 RepID=UPI0006917EB9|nr:TetR/AcrR family transcriptional regulator C-terminal domain-containing protein [Streptomyces sp. NRRL F-5727]
MAARKPRKQTGAQAGFALLWGEEEPPARGPKPSLTATGIAEAAVAIADAEGLDAVSLARVAQEFDVTAMALYRYVPGKTELVDLMVDLAIGPPPALGDLPAGWRPRLTAWARQCLALYRRHPWILTATGMRRRIMGPRQLDWLEAALAALDGTGLSTAQRHDTFLLLVGHVRAVAQQDVDHDAAESEEWARLTAQALARHEHRYPALAEAVATGAFAPREADPLDFGLERILDGVAALMDR